MSDFEERLKALNPAQRALLEQRLKARQNDQTSVSEAQSADYDVVILGGGLAGLTLARQLSRMQSTIRVLVLEKAAFPAPEAAFKVGESTVEIGAHYFGTMLDLAEHLKASQLPKFGLRFFFGADDNRDITKRLELGASFFPKTPSYQLDRGRFENLLWDENVASGIRCLDQCRVEHVELGDQQHEVTYVHHNEEVRVSARWVIDASGRAGALKRQLGLQEGNNHNVNSVWFRLSETIDLNSWSDDPAWKKRVGNGPRGLSTNHLMGEGYWVWLIPLSSGSISVGIVADATLHPFEKLNRFERALDWLKTYEPQCAEQVEAKRDTLQDFRVLKHFSHGCKQVFSAQRWCLSGEAGAFLDPFYSPGSDFIAMSNTFISDLIMHDLAGESIVERVERHNITYLKLYETFLHIYEGQYPIFGNHQVMATKILWDFGIYWAVPALLFFHNKLIDLAFVDSIGDELRRFNQLHAQMQAFFNAWNNQSHDQEPEGFIDLLGFDFLYHLNSGLKAGLNDTALRQQITKNVTLFEAIGEDIRRKASTIHPDLLEDAALPTEPTPLSQNAVRAIGELDTLWQRAAATKGNYAA